MKSRFVGVLSAAFLSSLAFVPLQAMATSIAPVVSCASLAGLSLPNTQIISATEVTTSPMHYCNVVGVIGKRVSAQDPDHFTYGIGFELNLPDSWVGRFEMQGGGGTDGSVSSPKGTGGTELSQGWAVAADDGGHEDRLPNPFGWTDGANRRPRLDETSPPPLRVARPPTGNRCNALHEWGGSSGRSDWICGLCCSASVIARSASYASGRQ
jgi:hypothetical protein